MSLRPGQQLELTIEKPAAGGRMIARHEGQVVLVQGSIPGERVLASVDRVERQVAFASTSGVLSASADRLADHGDPACGGCSYSHIRYPRQVDLKSEVVRDAFARLGRLPIAAPRVAPSPDRGYRMRARLHVRGDRAGFYREGTHELCDAAATGQLAEASVEALAACVRTIVGGGVSLTAAELTENVAADERIVHVIAPGDGNLTDRLLDDAMAASGLTGCSGLSADGTVRTAGVPVVTDPLSVLTMGGARAGSLQRRAESFFQANRFLLPQLVQEVTEAVPQDGHVLDLYAGVGLFSVALAALGRKDITAIEGDRTSGTDLLRNAVPYSPALRVYVESVEQYVRRRTGSVATIVVDPPRIGISREAMTAIVRAKAKRLVYVSCDPATMARDARRLVDGGYELVSLTAFDLFPNTPHVEALGIFAL